MTLKSCKCRMNVLYRKQLRQRHVNPQLYCCGCRCTALDKIGDKSSEEQRRKYFTEVDTDHSDGVDFEEFLEVSS